MNRTIFLSIFLLLFTTNIFSNVKINYRNIGDDVYLLEIEGSGWILRDFENPDSGINLLARYQQNSNSFFRLRFSKTLDNIMYFSKQNLAAGDFSNLTINLAKDGSQDISIAEEDKLIVHEEIKDLQIASAVELPQETQVIFIEDFDFYVENVIEIEDDNGQIYYKIGQHFEKKDTYISIEKAIEWYEKVIEFYPFSDYSLKAKERIVYLLNKYITIK